MSLQELEQDPFDPDEFLERLAWRTLGSSRNDADSFDPGALKASFERTIQDLKDMDLRVQAQVEKLENQCKEEEKSHWDRVAGLQNKNQVACDKFQELDERINFVATKVVHLGDQLEGVNTPRARVAEAQRLMKFFSEFTDSGPLRSPVWTDPTQLQQAADVIQKLHQIAQELPQEGQFDSAKRKIEEKYSEIEQELIQEFRKAHNAGDKRKMKRYANILSHFKGYHECIDVFIEESEKGFLHRSDIFEAIPPLVGKTNTLINEVFVSPEMAMSKLVLNLYHGKLQEHIQSVLSQTNDLEKYLRNLHDLYTKTTKLSRHLSSYKLGNDSSFLTKVTRHIFDKHTENYINMETRFLSDKCSTILQRYYESKSHQKKNISSGGMLELRRDLQAVIGNKANINIAPTVENYGGETFLSQEVAINLLQESKLAFKRCQVLSSRTDLPNNAARVFEILVQYLCMEHIEYAIVLGLQAIPLAEPKSEPQIYFFDVVGQANTIFHLFEKQFNDHLVPLVSSSQKHTECIKRKKEIMDSMENKLDQGLEKALTAICGWVKNMLTTAQKKNDFKVDAGNVTMQMSPVCGKVVKFITEQVETIRFGLDGKNVDGVLTELGIRFHRVLYEHFQQFQYSTMGGMLAICDVNEYRKCAKEMNIKMLDQLFDTLHALANLLVVAPENLRQVCTGEQLVGIDKSVLLSFIQLRSDYKTAKIANYFR